LPGGSPGRGAAAPGGGRRTASTLKLYARETSEAGCKAPETFAVTLSSDL
jgi:hypothetical protein